jgi:hypothetical protein
MGRLLDTEASTAAWQSFLLWNGVLSLIAIVPALLVANRLWRRAAAPMPAAELEAVAPTTPLSRSAAH